MNEDWWMYMGQNKLTDNQGGRQMDSQPDGQSAIRPRQTERQTNKQTNTGARERRETHGHTPVGKQRLSSNRELDNNATNKQTDRHKHSETHRKPNNQEEQIGQVQYPRGRYMYMLQANGHKHTQSQTNKQINENGRTKR